jgi:two-component system, OmpR family, sensor histidine kinase PhoQ
MTLALNTRLLLASSVVLAAFLGITGLVLDRAFRASADTALRDRLQGHVYALLAASDLDARSKLRLPAELPDPRFSLIGSGLYAEVVDSSGNPVWRSKSLLGMGIAFTMVPAVGQREFTRLAVDRDLPLLSLAFTVSWEANGNSDRRYTYRVAENLVGFNAEVSRFRRSLWGWLAGAAFLLLLVQSVVLRWSLAPLRRVADDLHAIETGLAQRLRGDYPRELRQLTDNLNGLLTSADSHLKRYRDSLGNLAHSLKTPLAVLGGALDGEMNDAALRAIAREQLDSMTRLVEYQLQRAAASGRASLAAPIAVKPVVEKIVAALAKVYTDKGVRVTLDVETSATFHGDAGDLTEMLGNLLDNACKWCRQQVRVTVQLLPASGAMRPSLDITIEDDGPGIPEDLKTGVLQRGARADATTPGHGLGLAMVQDTVALYHGELALETSPLGGLAVRLRISDSRP